MPRCSSWLQRSVGYDECTKRPRRLVEALLLRPCSRPSKEVSVAGSTFVPERFFVYVASSSPNRHGRVATGHECMDMDTHATVSVGAATVGP